MIDVGGSGWRTEACDGACACDGIYMARQEQVKAMRRLEGGVGGGLDVSAQSHKDSDGKVLSDCGRPFLHQNTNPPAPPTLFSRPMRGRLMVSGCPAAPLRS